MTRAVESITGQFKHNNYNNPQHTDRQFKPLKDPPFMTSLSTNIAILLVLLILLICHFNFFIFSCFHLIFQNPDSGPLGNVFKGKNRKNGKKSKRCLSSYILNGPPAGCCCCCGCKCVIGQIMIINYIKSTCQTLINGHSLTVQISFIDIAPGSYTETAYIIQ